MNFNNHNIGPDHGPQPRTPPPAGVQQWSVKAVTRGPEHFERRLPDVVIAADVNLAAEALCDRLAAPESPAERRYLIAAVTPEFDAAATRDRLEWSNLLTWCADGWVMSQWLPDTWRRSCSPPSLPDQGPSAVTTPGQAACPRSVGQGTSLMVQTALPTSRGRAVATADHAGRERAMTTEPGRDPGGMS